MPFERLQDAVDMLSKYIEMPGNATIPASVISPQIGDTTQKQATVSSEALKLLLDVSRGSLPANEMSKRIKGLTGDDAEAAQKIKFFLGADMRKITGIDVPKLSIIQSNTVRITPAGRFTDAIAMFLNMIPTLEMSRVVPYLTVDVQTKRPPISSDGRAQGLSLFKFLQGAANVSSKQGDKNMLLALQTNAEGKNLDDGHTTSGMEMFLSPQTLVDPDPTIDGRRSAPVIDKFRPFMSIEKLTVDVDPQVGFFAYRTANLELTLHDRSRLNEIADFVKADLFNSVELMLEYGWSHPDATDKDNNAYAILLNALRVREKYGIVNSSFSFTKSGEVKIKLRLFTKGFTDTQSVSIGDNAEQVKSARQAIEELQRVITEIRIRVKGDDTTKAAKEIRGEQQLFAHAEDLGATLELSKEGAAAVKKFLKANDKNLTGDMKTLHDSLLKLYGKEGKGGEDVKAVKTTVAENVNKKLASIKVPPKNSDPFLKSAKSKFDESFHDEIKDLIIAENNSVSFGRLMALFVGSPLASNNDRYEDVQLIFYPFNAKAGAVAQLNISEFPIRVDDLIKSFTGLGTQRGLSIPISDFLQHIMNNFIDDMSNTAYGLGKTYTTKIDENTGIRTPVGDSNKNDDTKLFTAVQKRLKLIGVQDGTFRMPQVDVMIETVPLDVSQNGQSTKIESKKTVLKIHFFDKCSSAYESLGQMILASRENELTALGNMSKTDANDHNTCYSHYLTLAANANIISAVKARDAKDVKVYNVKYDYEKLKRFIRQNMPSIIYGCNNTNIEDANFATMQDPRQTAINMMKTGDQGASAPAGLTKANLPLRTLPAKVSLVTAGCPLISRMQQFFIDFGTNTTCDNIYAVSKLSHELVPGKFQTRIDLLAQDAYGRYETLATQVGVSIQKIAEAIDQQSNA